MRPGIFCSICPVYVRECASILLVISSGGGDPATAVLRDVAKPAGIVLENRAYKMNVMDSWIHGSGSGQFPIHDILSREPD